MTIQSRTRAAWVLALGTMTIAACGSENVGGIGGAAGSGHAGSAAAPARAGGGGQGGSSGGASVAVPEDDLGHDAAADEDATSGEMAEGNGRGGGGSRMSPAPRDAGAGSPDGAPAVPPASRDAASESSNALRDATAAPRDAGSEAPAADAGPGATKAWRPFNAASPWNTPIDSSAKADPKSAELIADLVTSSAWPWITINIETYSVPVYQVDATTPLQTVTISSVGGQGFNTMTAKVPIPKGALPAEGTDAHLAIVNRATNQEWGMWATSNGTSGWTAEVAATADLSGSGVRPPTAEAPWWMGHGARACGYPLSAGLVTVDDLRAGAIEHALVIAYPHIRSRYYTTPASTAQAGFSTALPTRGLPCGARIQLDPALDLTSLKLSTSGKMVARALQKYGAFVGDFSGAVSLYADASPSAQAAFAAGLLDTYEVKDALGLKLFRALTIGTLLDNGN